LYLDDTKVIILILWRRTFQLEYWRTFQLVSTGVDKTVKRAVPLKVIRRIRDLDLTLSPVLDYARDLFMFSFYTRGMAFVDMAYLKKKDLQNGVLVYRRQKTGQQLFIKWEKPMQEIVGKYDTSATPYLLPIIRDMDTDARKQYKNAAHLVNDKLKKIGRQLGLAIPLTSYVARHAWASIAKSKNIPISTISEAMGHDSENTTRIYLASLDTSVVDKANSLILKSL
jgi:integrase